MDKRMRDDIADFLAAQTCVTVCCTDEQGQPYCFTCFYVFDRNELCFYFKSSAQTHHSGLLQINEHCAGTVLPDQFNAAAIQGIQFVGRAQKNRLLDLGPSIQYHAAYPVAVAVPGDIWTIYPDQIKFTDNTQGFGTKRHWNRSGEGEL